MYKYNIIENRTFYPGYLYRYSSHLPLRESISKILFQYTIIQKTFKYLIFKYIVIEENIFIKI